MAEIQGSDISSHPVRVPRAPEGLFDYEILYITTQGVTVRLDGERIRVDTNTSTPIGSFPLSKVSTVNLFGNIQVTTPFLLQCADKGIVVNYFSSYGKYKGSFIGVHTTIAEVRRKQYALSPAKALRISRKLISAKIRNSRTFLARKDIPIPDRMKNLERTVEHAESIESLRAIEGEAASLYFSLFMHSLPEGWEFQKRTKHPPRDPVNSLLSLTYTLISSEVTQALRQINLDPFMGVMHTDRHGRPSLSLDLMEEFRPLFGDAFVVRLLNKNVIKTDDFREDNHLNEDTFRKFLSMYDGAMNEEFSHPRFGYTVSRRRSIALQAILLRKAITGEMEDYHPLIFTR
jgi:CRISPR-associated protein Cas1